MKIGILVASYPEAEILYPEITIKKRHKRAGTDFLIGSFVEKNIVLALCGKSRASTTIVAQALLEEFCPDIALMTGVAGILNPDLNVGDVAVAKESMQYDTCTNCPSIYPSTDWLVNLALQLANKATIPRSRKFPKLLPPKVVMAKFLTGDIYVGNKALANKLRNKFKGDVVDQEVAAFAQSCFLNSIPFLAVKGLTDKPSRNSRKEIRMYLPYASRNAYLFIKELVRCLELKDR